MNHHLWWSAKVTFQIFCALGGTFFFLWLVGVLVSAWACRPRCGDHRVGGVWRP